MLLCFILSKKAKPFWTDGLRPAAAAKLYELFEKLKRRSIPVMLLRS